ncbi:unnamed protein product [Lampetra fluviatilis]
MASGNCVVSTVGIAAPGGSSGESRGPLAVPWMADEDSARPAGRREERRASLGIYYMVDGEERLSSNAV